MAQSIASRPFAWSDIPRLHELVSRRWPVDGPGAQMHIGDFYWTLRTTPDGDPLRDLRIWPRPDGSLLAFAWLDRPSAGDVIVAPDAGAAMLDEALDWLEREQRKKGRDSLSIVALDGDHARVEALRRRAYAPGEAGNVRFWLRLTAAPPPAPLPHGFSLRHVSTDDDVERRVFVEATSFDNLTITADSWRLRMHRLPATSRSWI